MASWGHGGMILLWVTIASVSIEGLGQLTCFTFYTSLIENSRALPWDGRDFGTEEMDIWQSLSDLDPEPLIGTSNISIGVRGMESGLTILR